MKSGFSERAKPIKYPIQSKMILLSISIELTNSGQRTRRIDVPVDLIKKPLVVV